MGRFRRVKQGLITSRSEDVLSNGTERKDVGQRPAAGPSSVDRRFVSRESRPWPRASSWDGASGVSCSGLSPCFLLLSHVNVCVVFSVRAFGWNSPLCKLS